MLRGTIYAVHYGEDAEVSRPFLNSVHRFLGADLSLVLVNNGPKGLFERWLYPHVTFLDTEANLGYFGGIQFGMLKHPVDKLDYVLICNNDILLPEEDFFQVVENKLKVWDVIAPSTRTLDNVEQNPHRRVRPSFGRRCYSRMFFSCFLAAWCCNQAYEWKKKRQAKRATNELEQAIFSPHGACMILNATFFKRGGRVDHPVFLYGEEDAIGAQADRLGLKVGFIPDLKVVHLESRSLGKGLTPAKFRYQKAAYRYIRQAFPQLF